MEAASQQSKSMWFSPDNLAEDERLVRAAKADLVQFLPLYNKYFKPILAYCRKRLPDSQDAEDICAETFLAALRQMDRYQYRALPFIVWLYKIAAIQIAGHYRKKFKHPEVEYNEALENHASEQPTACEVLTAQFQQAKVQAAIAELPDHWQSIITLKFHSGLSNQEIGKQLGLGESAVKMQYYRALQKLRTRLKGGDNVV